MRNKIATAFVLFMGIAALVIAYLTLWSGREVGDRRHVDLATSRQTIEDNAMHASRKAEADRAYPMGEASALVHMTEAEIRRTLAVMGKRPDASTVSAEELEAVWERANEWVVGAKPNVGRVRAEDEPRLRELYIAAGAVQMPARVGLRFPTEELARQRAATMPAYPGHSWVVIHEPAESRR